MVFIIETQCVYCAVRTESLYIIQKYFRLQTVEQIFACKTKADVYNSNSVKTKGAGIGIIKSFDMRNKIEVCISVYGMYGRTLISERVGDF
jgi:hypothetical protein